MPSYTPPPYDCPLCPRLSAFNQANRAAHPDWFNGPVPSFGDLEAKLLVVGLGPGLKGANRTGRPFTADYAGKILYGALLKHGLATGVYQERADDGLALHGVRITNAVRCVPPQNKPEPEEIRTCNRFLGAEIAAMPALRVILSLGSVSHGAVLRVFKQKLSARKFAHAAEHKLDSSALKKQGQEAEPALSMSEAHRPMGFSGENPGDIMLLSSYHTSRYNIQTNRLTQAMFDDIIARAKALMG